MSLARSLLTGGAAVLCAAAVTVAGCVQAKPSSPGTSPEPAFSGFAYERVIIDPVTEKEPWMKSAGDVNGDGRPDLIVSGRNGRVIWYENPGWAKHVIADEVTSQSGSAAADLDGDGDLDVVVGVTWYENLGEGGSWSAHELFAGNFAMTHDTVIADVDGDGRPDIAMRGETHSTVYVYLQRETGQFTLMTVDPGTGLNGLDAADLNGDGRRDLVIGGRWMQNPGGDIISEPWPVHKFGEWLGYAAVRVADIDGGRPDIVLAPSEEPGRLSWFEQRGDDDWAEHVITDGLDSVHGFIAEDLDRDGLTDLVLSEYRGQGRLTIYRQVRGGSGDVSWETTELGADKLHNIQAMDFNGDCRADFFGAFSLSEQTPVIAYLSTGPPAC
jgi:hypothetical protein